MNLTCELDLKNSHTTPCNAQKRLIDNGTVASKCPNMHQLAEGTMREPGIQQDYMRGVCWAATCDSHVVEQGVILLAYKSQCIEVRRASCFASLIVKP